MRQDEIIKGEATCKKALDHLSEGEQAIVFARFIQGFKDTDAADALAVMKRWAGDVEARLRRTAKENRKESKYACKCNDPREEMVLVLRTGAASCAIFPSISRRRRLGRIWRRRS